MRPLRLFGLGLMALGVGALTALTLTAASKTPPETPRAQNTPKAEARVVSFIAFGDSGSGLSPQRLLARQMRAWRERAPYSLALVLGDILYETGDIQKYGRSRYRDVYGPLMLQGVEFKPVLGNHDVLKGFKPAMLTFYGMPGRYYEFRRGPAAFFALDTNLADDPLQRRWLEKALAASDAPWKIVYGHHTVYSSGAHGSTGGLSWLAPLLARSGAALYLCGHDHGYERLGPMDGVTYVVSGGGGASLRDFAKTPHAASVTRAKAYHFLSVQATRQTLTLSAIDETGRALDSVTLAAKPSAAQPAAKTPAKRPATGTTGSGG